MTAITSATSTATTTAATASATSNTLQLGSADFLKLLMTQLTNQNPLDPTDPTAFTQQLATYSSVEQQVDMNSKLSTMSDTMSSLLTQVSLLASQKTS